jgi:hypothetical protein
MYLLTFSMIRRLDHFYFNLSNAWMALIMVAPMGLIMLLVMWGMFHRKALNIGLALGFVALFAGAFWLGRQETGVGNEGFLKSMIPHHSRAILVCQEATITDPEITALCQGIIQTQRAEIREMQELLEQYD